MESSHGRLLLSTVCSTCSTCSHGPNMESSHGRLLLSTSPTGYLRLATSWNLELFFFPQQVTSGLHVQLVQRTKSKKLQAGGNLLGKEEKYQIHRSCKQNSFVKPGLLKTCFIGPFWPKNLYFKTCFFGQFFVKPGPFENMFFWSVFRETGAF